MVAVPPRGRPDPLQVRAGAGLGHRDGADELSGRQPGQPVCLLLSRAIVEDVGDDDRVMERDGEASEPAFGQLFDQDDLVAVIAASAAVLCRNGQAKEAGLRRLGPHRAIDDAVLAPPRSPGRRRVLVEKLADRLPEDDDVLLLEEIGTIDVQNGHGPRVSLVHRSSPRFRRSERGLFASGKSTRNSGIANRRGEPGSGSGAPSGRNAQRGDGNGPKS